jgi:hypothetical protein
LPSADHILIEFGMASEMIRQGIAPVPLKKDEINFNFVIYSLLSPLKPVFDSVRFLTANEITEIERPFLRPRRGSGSGDRKIWSGYTDDSERRNILRILDSSLAEYRSFVYGNRLKFSNSPYLDSTTAVINVYERSKEPASFDWPVLDRFFIKGAAGPLPKLMTAIGYRTSPRIECEYEREKLTISVDGQKYSVSFHSTSLASFLFQPTPVMNVVYKMLCEDLEEHYGIRI